MGLELTTVLRRSDDPVAAAVDGQVLMMSLSQGRYFGLDTVGSRVWELLAAPIRIVDLLQQLQTDYDVDAETCARDTLPFLADLLSQCLVDVVEG